MLKRAQNLQDALSSVRQDVHQHPELSFQEHRTAKLVADRLTELGIAARTGVAKTGVIGDLGEAGPRIALRADMDALPMQEESGLEHASQTPGVMHACGHDGHTTMLLGAARHLSETGTSTGPSTSASSRRKRTARAPGR